MTSSITHHRIKALDGLRGLALLCVLTAHAGLPVFGGSLIMFVLSGYVITASLVREHERTGTIDVRRFYTRRARRLLPALCVMLVGVNLLMPLIHPDSAAHLPIDTLAALAFVSNWTQMFATHTSPLLHLWSLSVQEQVYVVWPLAAYLALSSRRRLMGLCVAGAVSACGLRVVSVLSGAPLLTLYFNTFTRIDGVLLSSALALAPAPRLSARGGRVLRVACVLTLAVSLCLWRLHNPFVYLVSMPLASVCAAGLIATLLNASSLLSRALSCRALVHLGTISYGVYLWHYPLIVLLSGLTPYAGVVGVIGGLMAGEASYRLVERPCMERKTRLGERRV